jgi:Leucine-rich repeat (LRR) protein
MFNRTIPVTGPPVIDASRTNERVVVETLNGVTHDDANGGFITVLINDCCLTEIPLLVVRFPMLTKLSAFGNNIQKVPSVLCNAEYLEYLGLSSNAIDELPVEIGKLRQLRFLYLDSNKLKHLPRELGKCVSLKALNLSGNLLESLPTSLVNLTQLYTLRLDYNPSLPCDVAKLISKNTTETQQLLKTIAVLPTRNLVVLLLGIRKTRKDSSLQVLPRDVVKLIALELWNTRASRIDC